MSTAANAAQIALIQAELANSKRVADLTNTEKREVLTALFPDGVALPFDSPLIVTGDLVYGTDPSINFGAFCFGYALSDGAVTGPADINIKLG